MSSLKVRQITSKLRNLFEQHLDLSDIPATDQERDNKVLSRCLAAYAVYMKTACAEEDAAAAVWDGQDDNGIDAAYFEPSESRVIVVQSKWFHVGSGEPATNDIATFTNGVKDLIEGEPTNFADRLQAQFEAICESLMTPGVTVETVVITTGASALAKHATANLDRMLHELNGQDDVDALASKDVVGLTEVYDSLAARSAPDRITITANLSDWSSVTEPYLAYFGLIDRLQLKEWWAEHGKRLVAKNIRHALGATEVNEGIRRTATSVPENFWYFNNGITLIAEQALRAPKAAASKTSGLFEFKGGSIVNGAQTVSTLARIEDDESLGKVRVPVRIIILEETPDSFGSEVTRTNNLQNRVEGRDFVADDPEQQRLQREMSMEDIDYQFLRSEDLTTGSSACELIEVTTALACASADPSLAVQVKTGIGRFFIDLKRAPYKTLYNPKTSGAFAFNVTLVQRAIDAWIEEKKHQTEKKSGYSWGVLIHGNRMLAASVFKRLPNEELDLPIKEFQTKLESLEIATNCERAYVRMVAKLNQDYPNKFLAVLFKSPAMSKDIFEYSTH